MDITQLLAFSVKNKASDLHLSAGLPPMIRVHGDVRRINVDALDHKTVHAMVYDIMSDAQRKTYEEFLEVYDNVLRKKTGSYYTPPEVVSGMVKMVQEALQSPGFGLPQGLASPSVTIADPAVGTGTYVLGLLRHIAHIVESEQGAGAVKAAVEAAPEADVAVDTNAEAAPAKPARKRAAPRAPAPAAPTRTA